MSLCVCSALTRALLQNDASAPQTALLRRLRGATARYGLPRLPLLCSPQTGTAVLRAHRAYSPGDEVFDSYGPWKSRSDLLLDYGFVDEANGNAWVEVPLASLACPRGSSARAFFAAAGGMLEELGAVLDAESAPDSSILSWIRCGVVRGVAKVACA